MSETESPSPASSAPPTDRCASLDLAQMALARDAWREFAYHVAGCVECGETNYTNCFDGNQLHEAAKAADEGQLTVEPTPSRDANEASDLRIGGRRYRYVPWPARVVGRAWKIESANAWFEVSEDFAQVLDALRAALSRSASAPEPSDEGRTRYCLGFLFAPDGSSVVLLTKTHPSWQAGLLNGIGGHVEAGESPYDAMGRETMEELGPAFADVRWELYEIMSGDGWICHVYRAFDDVGAPLPEQSDAGEPVGRYHPTVLNTERALRTIPNLAWLIPRALDRETTPLAQHYAASAARSPSREVAK